MDSYAKNDMSAVLFTSEGMDLRVVIKDGKSYTVLDEYQTVMVQDADQGDAGYGGNTDDMTYIGEGSGDFLGKTYKYDEYKDKDGDRFFYYVDGGALKGIRSIVGGEAADVEVLALDKNIPDSVFNIPSDYDVMEY